MMSVPASPWGTFDLPILGGRVLERLRSEHTRGHAITKAVGGVPTPTAVPEEVSFFASHSVAPLVNLGALDISRPAAIPQAVTISPAYFMAADPQAEARPLRQIVGQAPTSRSVQA